MTVSNCEGHLLFGMSLCCLGFLFCSLRLSFVWLTCIVWCFLFYTHMNNMWMNVIFSLVCSLVLFLSFLLFFFFFFVCSRGCFLSPPTCHFLLCFWTVQVSVWIPLLVFELISILCKDCNSLLPSPIPLYPLPKPPPPSAPVSLHFPEVSGCQFVTGSCTGIGFPLWCQLCSF